MLTCGSLFSGIGLLDYGLHQAGLHHAWFCEADPWRRTILAKRWPGAPVLDDVRTVGADSVPRVDVIAGGFPCKGASNAGKREGFGHAETVLWYEMLRAIRELRPRYVLVENVEAILRLHDGWVWGEVLRGLAESGFDVVWDCLPAAAVGAPHRRDRVFAIAADTERVGWSEGTGLRAAAGSSVDGVGWGRSDNSDGEVFADAALAGWCSSGGPGQQRGLGCDVGAGDDRAAPNASRDAEGRAGPSTGADGERVGQGDHAAADADDQGRDQRAQRDGASTKLGEQLQTWDQPVGRGIRVEWGDYGPAIRRWEAVHGPAPEPLVRGVDDRSAARVERSRLSALGDGVQVQVGYLAGRYIVELERQRLAER